MNKAVFALCLAGALAASGCATIVSKSQYPVTISSTPPGATAVIRNSKGLDIHKVQTPTTVTLSASQGYFSKAKYTVELQKDGYLPYTAPLNAAIDPWYLGNIIFGGAIGMLLVDPVSGAMWELDDSLIAGMTPVAATATADTGAVAVPASEATSEGAAAQAPAESSAAATAAAAAPAATPSAGTPAPAPAGRSIAERLRELKQLKDQGLLTDNEYETKRAALVEQL